MNTSAPDPKSKSSAPLPPKWWSPSMAVWFVLGFAALAGLPYLTSAGKLMAEGKELSAEAVKKEMKAKESEKHKEDMKKEDPEKLREIKGLAIGADGTVYGGGKAGLFSLKDGEWNMVEGFDAFDVKALAVAANGSLYVAHHDGVSLRSADGQWSQAYEGEVHTVATGADGTVYLSRHKPATLLKHQPDGSWAKVNDGLPVPDAGMMKKPEKEEKHGKEADD